MEQYKCRVDASPLEVAVNFGMQPLGNGFLKPEEFTREYFYTMAVGFSEKSAMLQLLEQPDPKMMFHENYAFFSTTSKAMEKHFSEFCNFVIDSSYIAKDAPFVVELGCNDGILLKNFQKLGIKNLGIEPSSNVAQAANKLGIDTISEFFTEELAKSIVDKHGKADVFISANVMCHIPDLHEVIRGIKVLLKPRGVVIFEDPYLGDVIEKTSYDQIYDEHVFLFSAHSVSNLFSMYGMELIDAIPQKTHGGSMRYVLANEGEFSKSSRVLEILEKEQKQGLHLKSTFVEFAKKVNTSKEALLNLLRDLKSQGKKIAAYGAASKSTTVLNFCGIGPEIVEYICDTTPTKIGKFSPGMHIPIVTHNHFVENPPDYAILFAWNHADEIMQKETDFMSSGGKWIIHVPEVRIL